MIGNAIAQVKIFHFNSQVDPGAMEPRWSKVVVTSWRLNQSHMKHQCESVAYVYISKINQDYDYTARLFFSFFWFLWNGVPRCFHDNRVPSIMNLSVFGLFFFPASWWIVGKVSAGDLSLSWNCTSYLPLYDSTTWLLVVLINWFWTCNTNQYDTVIMFWCWITFTCFYARHNKSTSLLNMRTYSIRIYFCRFKQRIPQCCW